MKKVLGIELGSTRIKSILIDENGKVLAKGSHEWENKLVGGLWSYSLESVALGVRESYKELACDYASNQGETLCEISAIGISAMMHGYLAFDKYDNLLTPFRTWRNTNTEAASCELSKLLNFQIPMRWSVSHFYQAVLNGESHIKDISSLNTLAGYVHYKLTGERVLGIGDASGMFPTDAVGYDKVMLKKFNKLLNKKGVYIPFESLLPKVLVAGENAGCLTEAGARWLDPSGALNPGCVFCPPEGDAGTGMVATNSVSQRSANISAGTSAFLMAVLEKPLESYFKEIDVVATPSGEPVAMVHVNNFGSEITAIADLFEEIITLCTGSIDRDKLFSVLYKSPLNADEDCGGLMGYNFLSGEPIVNIEKGVPMIIRGLDCKLSVANLMKMQIYSALGSLAIGCRILGNENIKIERVCAHGGFFKTPDFTGSAMACAVGAPVTLLKNASEGGAYGISLLALFTLLKRSNLADFLDTVFTNVEKSTISATDSEKKAFESFIQRYEKGLLIEKLAGEAYGNA